MYIVACACASASKPAFEEDAAASTPSVLLTTEKLLKTSQPHVVGNVGEDAFLVQVIRCRSSDVNASQVLVNTTVEKLPPDDDELESDALTTLNITVEPSTVLNHTFYIEGVFVWTSNSSSVDPTALLDNKWVVRMSCYDNSSKQTVYSEPVMETLIASQSPQAVNVPREHAANPLNLLPGTVVLPLQVCTCVCVYMRVCVFVWMAVVLQDCVCTWYLH